MLTLDAAAEALGLCRRTIEGLINKRHLGVVRIGKSVRVHPDDLAALIERNRVKSLGWKERK